MSFFREHTTIEAILLALFDALCFIMAYILAIAITLPERFTYTEWFISQLAYLIMLIITWWFEATGERLFVSRRSEALVPQMFAVVRAVFISLILSAFVLAHIGEYGLERRFVLAFWGPSILFIVTFRLMVRLSLWGIRRRGYNYRRILIIGANDRTAHLAEVILSHEQYGYHLEGFLEDDEGRREYLSSHSTPYLGKIQNLERILIDRVIDVVYISLPVRSYYETIQSIAHLCEGVGVQVRLIADLFPLRIATSKASRIGDIPLLTLSSVENMRTSFALKRLTQMLIATILLIILIPVLGIIALLIKLDSRGPVMTGEYCMNMGNKRRFNLLKFRTHHIEDPDSSTMTKIGKILHRYSLDELPQLFNVWCGQMSFTEQRPQPVKQQDEPAI